MIDCTEGGQWFTLSAIYFNITLSNTVRGYKQLDLVLYVRTVDICINIIYIQQHVRYKQVTEVTVHSVKQYIVAVYIIYMYIYASIT